MKRQYRKQIFSPPVSKVTAESNSEHPTPNRLKASYYRLRNKDFLQQKENSSPEPGVSVCPYTCAESVDPFTVGSRRRDTETGDYMEHFNTAHSDWEPRNHPSRQLTASSRPRQVETKLEEDNLHSDGL